MTWHNNALLRTSLRAAAEGWRSMKTMKDNHKRNLVRQVVKSTAVSVATVLCAVIALSLWSTAQYYEPPGVAQFAQTRMDHFTRCMAIWSLNLLIPLAICMVATMCVSLLRGKHGMIAGCLSGAIIFGLTMLEYSVELHHHSLILRRIILIAVIPMAAASLQFIRTPNRNQTSNKKNAAYG